MRNRKIIWAREDRPTEQPIRRATDVTNIEPDALRDSVRNALSALTADELASWRDHLLNGLREAGLNLGACSFLIGISAASTNALTPSGIAHLIRYVRINLPETMKVIAERLGNLLLDSNDLGAKAKCLRAA